MLERKSRSLCEGIERAELVAHISLHFLRGAGHISAAEAHEIRKARVSAERDRSLPTETCGLRHHEGIAGVIAAGHIGGRNLGDDLLVEAYGVGTEALAEIRVKIHMIHSITSFNLCGIADPFLCGASKLPLR